jgi:hypothetical protein
MRTLECSERSIQKLTKYCEAGDSDPNPFQLLGRAALLFCLLLNHPQLVDNLPGMGRNSTKEPAENPE